MQVTLLHLDTEAVQSLRVTTLYDADYAVHSKRVNVKSPVVRHYIIDEPVPS